MTESMDVFAAGWIDPTAANQGMVNRAKAQQQYENSARPATVSFTHSTTGTGDFVDATLVNFGVTFTAMPSFTSGINLLKLPDPTHWKYPRAQAAVYRWEKDGNGNYLGAYLVYSVDVPPIRDPMAVQLELEKARQDSMFLTLREGIYESRVFQMDIVAAQEEVYQVQAGAGLDLSHARSSTDALVLQDKVKVQQAGQMLQLAKDAAAAAVPVKQADVVIEHHIAFYGTAVKQLPDSLYAEMSQL